MKLRKSKAVKGRMEILMKTAIVTGASSGIGTFIVKNLIEEGYRVYGFGRHFNDVNDMEEFITIELDLKYTDRLVNEIKKIRKNENISLLINNAGAGYFALHEEINIDKIHEMVCINLEIPMILTQLLLRDIKKNRGTIINISSVTAKKSNTYGCAYGATKAGLSSFASSLFDETRKYGVKVVTIHPDMTKTNLYRNADFDVGDTDDTYLNPKEVADAVKWVLNQREGMVITDITLKPQYHRLSRKSQKDKNKI